MRFLRRAERRARYFWARKTAPIKAAILRRLEPVLAPFVRFANRPRIRTVRRISYAIFTSAILWCSAAAIAFGMFIRPEVLVRMARHHAQECLAKARAPRGRELPDCMPLIEEFIYPASVPYTMHDATYRGEELYARVAVNEYIDAAVGDPNPEKLAAGAEKVRDMQQMMEDGSRRISLEELGPAIMSPHRGKLASSLGDRTTLLNHSDDLDHWHLKRDALEAALIEADFEELDALAKRYAAAELDNADFKTMVGASLCIASPEQGLEILGPIPDQRAEKRYANIQRDFGEVHATLVACGAKIGFEPGRAPSGPGGSADVQETRLVVALRTSTRGPHRDYLVSDAIERLQRESGFAAESHAPFARAMALAAILELSNEPLAPKLLGDIATPRADAGELKLAPTGLSLRELLDMPVGLSPIVPATWLRSGGQTLLAAAEKSKDDPDLVRVLDRAAGGLFTLAAREFALNGDVEAAVATAERGARLNKLTTHATALSVASAAYVAGSPKIAWDLIASVPANSSSTEKPSIMLAFDTLRVLVAASLGDDDEAVVRFVSDLAARPLLPESPEVSLDARWVVVAFAPKKVDADSVPVWTGQAENLERYRERGEKAVSAALASWSAALVRPPEERRAFRYALLDRRGDMPAQALAYMVAGAKLLDEPATSDAAEIWLDALTAIDARRLRIRSYVWMRLEAARIRKDAYYTALWTERLAVLREVAREDENLEITRFLRF